MNKILTVAMICSLALPVLANEGSKDEGFKLIHVSDLAAELKSEQPPKVFDANNKDTRSKYGVIPGAVLLSNYKKYSVAKVLPATKDTAVVFYCANTKCMASHEAAKRAVKAGYSNVSVMADGIMGWKDSGQPVGTPTKQ